MTTVEDRQRLDTALLQAHRALGRGDRECARRLARVVFQDERVDWWQRQEAARILGAAGGTDGCAYICTPGR